MTVTAISVTPITISLLSLSERSALKAKKIGIINKEFKTKIILLQSQGPLLGADFNF